MLLKIEKSALAEQDLIDIWLYTFREWGEAQADKYLDDMEGAFKLIAEQPLLCREREEFTPPIRICHQAHHLILYKEEEGRVFIIRVLHESMDIDSHLP